VIAGELISVGKETDRKWEDGEDISILDRSMIRYTPKKAKADAETIQELSKIPLRQLMRDTGLSHHTLLLIKRGQIVKKKTLQKVKEYLQSENN
jgi:hypothetical protein